MNTEHIFTTFVPTDLQYSPVVSRVQVENQLACLQTITILCKQTKNYTFTYIDNRDLFPTKKIKK